MQGFDPRNAPAPIADGRARPNEGEIFYEEKLMADPRHDEVRRMLSKDGGAASPRNQHY